MIHVKPEGAPLFRFAVAGVPVRVHATFFLVSAVLGAQQGGAGAIALWIALVLPSVLAHELGHAFAARAFGLRAEIDLHTWGGLTSFPGGGRLTPARSLAVTLAGPGTSIVLGLAALALQASGAVVDEDPTRVAALGDLVYINLVWGLLNLLPILPLDGGSAFHTLVGLIRGVDADLVAPGVSLGVSALAFAYSIQGGLVWTALLSASYLHTSYRLLRARLDERRDARAREGLAAEMDQGGAQAELRDAIVLRDMELAVKEAVLRDDAPAMAAAGLRAMEQAGSPEGQREAAAAAVTGHALAGDERSLLSLAERPDVAVDVRVTALLWVRRHDRALEVLRAEIAGEETPTLRAPLHRTELRQREWQAALAFLDDAARAGLDAPALATVIDAGRLLHRDADAARAGEALFERAPDPDLAFVVARAWARAGDSGRAASWLLRAADGGFRHAALLHAARDLDAARGDPAFQEAEAAVCG